MQQVNVLIVRKKVYLELWPVQNQNEDYFIFPVSDAGPLLGRRTAEECRQDHVNVSGGDWRVVRDSGELQLIFIISQIQWNSICTNTTIKQTHTVRYKP